jgi:PIN domain nuclease of toxin-antitoxin system
MKLLLDTCCIIWAISEPSAISERAKALLVDGGSEIFVSAISAAELACAADRGRVIVELHWKQWVQFYIEQNGWQVEKIRLEIIEEAYSLPEDFHADPADRIITATARLNHQTILTADKKILSYPHVNSIW